MIGVPRSGFLVIQLHAVVGRRVGHRGLLSAGPRGGLRPGLSFANRTRAPIFSAPLLAPRPLARSRRHSPNSPEHGTTPPVGAFCRRAKSPRINLQIFSKAARHREQLLFLPPPAKRWGRDERSSLLGIGGWVGSTAASMYAPRPHPHPRPSPPRARARGGRGVDRACLAFSPPVLRDIHFISCPLQTGTAGYSPNTSPHAFFKNSVRSTRPLTLSVRPSISSTLSVR